MNDHPGLSGRLDEPWFDFDAPAMVWVASQRDRDKVLALLEHGADIDAPSRWAAGSYTALQHCVDGASEESLEFAEFLIGQGATIDFFSAAGLGRVDVLRESLAQDPGLARERGPDGATALHFAATVEIADLLLEAGADPGARCVDHESTAAMWLLKSNPEISRHLVENGGPVDIFMAAALGDLELIDLCLEAQPDAVAVRISGTPEWTDFTGGGDKYIWVLGLYRSPHQVAREFGNGRAFSYLLEKSPAQVQLLVACECGDRDLAEQLLADDPGAVRELPEGYRRLLADAAWEGEVESVRLMLDLGFDPHATGDHDSTPLDRAAFHGYGEIVELLLAADPQPPLARRNEFGGTPISTCLFGNIHGWVTDTDYPRALRALLEAGSEFNPEWLPHPDRELDAILREYAGLASAQEPDGGDGD